MTENTSTPHPALHLVRAAFVALATMVVLTITLGATPGAAAPYGTPQVASQQVAAKTVSAAATPKRIRAYEYARRQHGEPYRYGGSGPSSWDCSGLVQAAYKSAGISLPRTTGDMLRDTRDQMYRTNHPRNGDLVLSSGHVELYTHYKHGRHVMYGAHKSGTVIGWKNVYSGLKFYHVRGAG